MMMSVQSEVFWVCDTMQAEICVLEEYATAIFGVHVFSVRIILVIQTGCKEGSYPDLWEKVTWYIT